MMGDECILNRWGKTTEKKICPYPFFFSVLIIVMSLKGVVTSPLITLYNYFYRGTIFLKK